MPTPVYGDVMVTGARTAAEAEAAREAAEREADPINKILSRRTTAADLLDGGAAIRAELEAVETRRAEQEKARKAEAARIKEALPALTSAYAEAQAAKVAAAIAFSRATEVELLAREDYDTAVHRARKLGVKFTPQESLGVLFGRDKEIRRAIRDFEIAIRRVW